METVFQGVAQAGQPTILATPSSSSAAGDLIVSRAGPVSAFFAAGLVSAAVSHHYSTQTAVQIEYAPLGVPTGLCAALATTAFQNEGLSLQPCSVPGTTVWIKDFKDSSSTSYFPLVNGSTTDFCHPFGMTVNGDPAGKPLPQIKVRHLIDNPEDVPNSQLWGANLLN